MVISLLNTSYEVDPSGNKPYWKLISSGLWEIESFQLLQKRLDEKSTFWDIGSWAGPLTLFAANHCKQVISIEPDPVIFEELKKNVKLNSKLSEKVTCLPFALSKEDGKMKLFARDSYGRSSSSLLNRTYDQRSEVVCDCLSFDSLIEKQKNSIPTFIKIDVEGGEFLALPNMKNGLQKINHPDLLIAFHYDQLREHLWLKNLKSVWFSKLIMKIEVIFGLNFLKKKCKKIIERCFASLNQYSSVYTVDQKLVSKDKLFSQFGVSKNPQLLFTNKKW